jgi:hypothetical protein
MKVMRWKQSGQAIVALLQQAANLSNQQCERAMDMAHKLGMQLRAAEDRIKHLQAERDDSKLAPSGPSSGSPEFTTRSRRNSFLRAQVLTRPRANSLAC